MEITINTQDGELFYEIGDWANALPITELVTNFAELPKLGRDIIAAAVIRYTMQDISGSDDEADANNIRERFNDLVR